jgi:hypothetical protein
LRRLGATNWTLSPIAFTPTIQPPVNPYVVPHQDPPPAGAISMSYVIATLSADGLTQSVPSGRVFCQNNIFAAGAYNIVTGPSRLAPRPATQYIIYKKVGGSYGYIGRTTGVQLVDDNIAADLSSRRPCTTPVSRPPATTRRPPAITSSAASSAGQPTLPRRSG